MKNLLPSSVFQGLLSAPALFRGLIMSFCLFLFLMGIGNQSFAQTSPSGQAKFVVPTTLSSCNRDTICVLVTNSQGGKGITYSGNVTIDVDIPGGTQIPYVSGSVKSFPAGATEVSYAANKLKISVPLPVLGTTTRVCFVVLPECSISNISGLPSFAGKITYPAAYPTPTETFTSSLINVGTPKLSMYNYKNPGVFGVKAYMGYGISNTGYGSIDEVTLYTIVPNALVLDSIKITSSPNYHDVFLTPTAIMPIVTPYDATHSLHTYKLKGVDLGSDGILEVRGNTFLEEYFSTPAVCATYDFTSWPDYTCKSGTQVSCMPPVKITSKIEISAGTPKLDGTLVSAESPDGCPNKHIVYKVKNNGVGNAAPVGNAYDINLNINFGSGLLSLINLKLNGVAVPAANITPTTGSNNSSFTIKLKDLMTTDPDGAGGISDIDGDGFFDDMLVGAETTVSFDYNIPCNLVCGANILYDVKSTATFTDFCKTLAGSTTSALIKFGFRQEQSIEQVNTPDYGIVSTGQSVAKNVRYNFKYQQFNMDFTNAVAEIRISYSKKFEIDLSTLKFNGVSVTGIRLGTDTQASTTATDPAQTTTSKDSVVVITLTPAQVTALFDANGDSLSYTQIYYGCTDRQTTTSADNWQLIMKMKSGLCTDGSTPCSFDLACKKPYVYGSGNSCGNIPCFITTNELKRVAPTGYTDVTKITPLLADPGRLYTGDTLQYAIGTSITSDYPLSPNGTWLNSYGGNDKKGDLHYKFSFNYSVPKGYQGEYPFLFTEKNSKVVVRQRTPNPSDINQIGTLGAVLFEAPLLLSDFADFNNLPATVNNNGTYGGYPITTAAINCGLYPWDWGQINCPLEEFYYYGYNGNISSGRQFNTAQDKVTDAYQIWTGAALARAGWFGDVGDDNYYIEVQTKWVVNPKFPWDNTNSFSTRAYSGHYGNGTTEWIQRCNIPAASALAVTKDYYIPNPRAIYKPECSLRISNKIDFKSYSGNYFQNGEVRVPFTVDKIVATIPSEYALTSASNITLDYYQSCSAQTTAAITASATSGIVTFTNSAGGDFPRVDDCAGLTTAYNLSYTLAKVGTAAPNNYKMPIQIFTKDEWGAVVILYDTLTIAEANPVLTLTPLNSVVKIDDGGACGTSFVDYVIQNNTLFAAPNTYFAVKSSANTTVTDITDGGNVYGDPIIAGDIATYGGTNKIVKIGTLGAGDKRIVRIFFQTNACADQLDVYTDFGCSYPSPFEPNLASTTLKTAQLSFTATDPVIISRPTAAVSVANLCDNKDIYIQVNNATNANVYKMLAGVKFPAGISYVAGSGQVYNNAAGAWNNIPAADITSPSTDSLAINLANTAPFNTSCGLEGSDKYNGLAYIKLTISFTACPTTNVESILYKVQAESFCGTKTSAMGVFPVNFVGEGKQNNYTLSTKATSIKLCTKVGVALPVNDVLYIKNLGGYGSASGASSGKDSVTLTIPFNTADFTLTSLATAAPFSSPVFGTDPQGKLTMRVLIPAGIAVGDSLAMPLTYSITPVKDKLCTVASTPPLCFFGLFSTPFSLECAAKGLSCTSTTSRIIRGSGLSLRAFECCYGSLGNYIWKDTNKDGKQGTTAAEPPIAGVKIYLLDGTTGAKLDSTVSDITGKYTFDSLSSGTYKVKFIVPAGSEVTSKTTGTDNATDSNINPDGTSDVVTIDVSLPSGDIGRDNPTIDAGIVPAYGSIGDYVWMDNNNDGQQISGEPAIAGVKVYLLNGVGVKIDSTVTDIAGKYLFDSLLTGIYQVKFVVPVGTIPAKQNIGADVSDSDANKAGLSQLISIDVSKLATDTLRNNLQIDAGFTPVGSIGDYVWKDANNNGLQDTGELAVSGVIVQLLQGTTVVSTDTTDAGGLYLFSNLSSGTYQVKLLTTSLPAGCILSTKQNLGGDDTKDSDFDPTTGLSQTVTIDALGTGIAKDNLTVDAGLYSPKGSIGDYVWKDANNNGLQDETTANGGGVANVIVELYKNGTLLTKDTTDATGKYLFSNLDAGTYKIKIVSATLPAGCEISSLPNAGTDDTKDSDVDKTTGFSGDYLINPTDPTKKDFLTVDAGLYSPKGSIGDFVWKDANNNGLQDETTANGGGVANVIVELYKNGTLLTKDTTDATGKYLFSNLDAGTYKIKIVSATLPAGCEISSLPNAGTDDTKDSDVDKTTGYSGDYVINPTDPTKKDFLTVDAGVTNTCAKSVQTQFSTCIDNVQLPTPIVGEVWSVVSGNPSNATINQNGMVAGMTAFGVYHFTLSNGICSETFEVTHLDCMKRYDLSLKKRVNNKLPQIGEVVSYTIVVRNQGEGTATGVEVSDTLPAGLQYQNFNVVRGTGVYNPSTSIWNLGTLVQGDSAVLTISVKVVSQGVIFNKAEISKMNEKDIDSTPGNNNENEDDLGRACISTPITICQNEEIEVIVPSTFQNVQWFRNTGTGTVFVQTGNTIFISTSGIYTYLASNGTCPAEGCCPVIVIVGDCCKPNVCIPYSITKTKGKK